jgi:hypothetical protein
MICPYCGEDPCQTPMACNEAAVLEQCEPLEEDIDARRRSKTEQGPICHQESQ